MMSSLPHIEESRLREARARDLSLLQIALELHGFVFDWTNHGQKMVARWKTTTIVFQANVLTNESNTMSNLFGQCVEHLEDRRKLKGGS